MERNNEMENLILHKIKYACSEAERVENELLNIKDEAKSLLEPFIELYTRVNLQDITEISIKDNGIQIYYQVWRNEIGDNFFIPFSVILSDNPRKEKQRLEKIERENREKEAEEKRKIDIENRIKTLQWELERLNEK